MIHALTVKIVRNEIGGMPEISLQVHTYLPWLAVCTCPEDLCWMMTGFFGIPGVTIIFF